jgi:regulator of protease activity HflC (stomatin/prohibitin superfamily)
MAYIWITVLVVMGFVLLSLAVRVIKKCEQGVLFRVGRVVGVRQAGLPSRPVVTLLAVPCHSRAE